MKDVVLNKFIEERINLNKELFNSKEYVAINKNKELIKKIYILGVIDGKKVYRKKSK